MELEGEEKEKDLPCQEPQVDPPGDCEAPAENIQDIVESEGGGEKRKREAEEEEEEEWKLEEDEEEESPEKKSRQVDLNDTPDLDEYEEMARADRQSGALSLVQILEILCSHWLNLTMLTPCHIALTTHLKGKLCAY